MTTAPFRNPGAMTVVAGVSCLQLVQDRDGEGKRPLEDVFSLSDRGDPRPLPRGSVHVLEGGTAAMENRARSSCCGDCTDSGPCSLDMTWEEMCESSSPVDLSFHPHGLVVDAGWQGCQVRPFPGKFIGDDLSGGSMTAPVCFLPAPVFEPAVGIVHAGKLPGHEE